MCSFYLGANSGIARCDDNIENVVIGGKVTVSKNPWPDHSPALAVIDQNTDGDWNSKSTIGLGLDSFDKVWLTVSFEFNAEIHSVLLYHRTDSEATVAPYRKDMEVNHPTTSGGALLDTHGTLV